MACFQLVFGKSGADEQFLARAGAETQWLSIRW
jgi:hypothetical protein